MHTGDVTGDLIDMALFPLHFLAVVSADFFLRTRKTSSNTALLQPPYSNLQGTEKFLKKSFEIIQDLIVFLLDSWQSQYEGGDKREVICKEEKNRGSMY